MPDLVLQFERPAPPGVATKSVPRSSCDAKWESGKGPLSTTHTGERT
jgi:hypothetical protein